jgi:hypothetical protein
VSRENSPTGVVRAGRLYPFSGTDQRVTPVLFGSRMAVDSDGISDYVITPHASREIARGGLSLGTILAGTSDVP